MEVESWLEWKTIRRRMPYYMPILLWLPKYNWRESLIYDLFAGVAVAAMIIPQVRSSPHARTHARVAMPADSMFASAVEYRAVPSGWTGAHLRSLFCLGKSITCVPFASRARLVS